MQSKEVSYLDTITELTPPEIDEVTGACGPVGAAAGALLGAAAGAGGALLGSGLQNG